MFARRYLNAYDAYYKNNSRPANGAWFEAFQYADSGYSSVLENLNQGINSHINFDLGIIVYNTTYTSASDLVRHTLSPADALQDDYNRVNDILFNVAAPANAGVAQRYDPSGTLSNPVVVATTPVVVDALAAARSGAYANGLGLLAQPTEASRNAQIAVLDTLTTVAAIAIEGNRLGLMGSTAASRTAYCQANRF